MYYLKQASRESLISGKHAKHSYNISSSLFIDANHILKSIVHPLVEITEDLSGFEKKKSPHFSTPAVWKENGPSPWKKTYFSWILFFLQTG
jgi:hypothetical protein